jgi:hypothetical protein
LNFKPSQIKYCTLEKELYAGHACMEKWKIYLAFVKFVWITDNSCLKFANSFKTNNWKVQRWLSEIMGFSFSVIQRKSHQMKISDHLSRNTANLNQIKFSSKGFVEFQKADPLLRQVRNYVSLDRWPNSPKRDILQFFLNRNNLEILPLGELVINCPSGLQKFCIPEAIKNEIMEEYHNHSHPGIDICYDKIATKYFWPGMKKDITEFIRSCHYCQTAKPNNHPNRAPLGKFFTPSGPYEMLSIDLIGPLRETDLGNIYIFTAIDGFSKKVSAEAIYQKKSHYLLQIFRGLIFRNPQFPKFVVLDNAPEFNAISNFLKENNIEPHFIPPRHPQSNGLIENANRTIKARLRAKTNLVNWDLFLHEIIHEINSSQHSVLKYSPFTVETGVRDSHNFHDSNWRNYGNKIDIKFGEIRDRIEVEKNRRIEKFKNDKFSEYSVGDLVLIKNFRSSFPPFIGPFRIIYKSPAGTWYNCKNNDSEFRRHADNLKPYKKRETPNIEMNARETDYLKKDNNLQILFDDDSSEESFFWDETDSVTSEKSGSRNDSFNRADTSSLSSEGSDTKSSSTCSSESSSDIEFLTNHLKESEEVLAKQRLEISEIFNCLPKPDINLEPCDDKSELSKETENSENSEENLNQEADFFVDDELELEPNSVLNDCEPDLTSYDKLSESILGNERKRERSDDSLVSRKIAKFTHDHNLQNMAILIKMEYDDRSFFDNINDKWKNDEIENTRIENGMFLSLRELTKDILFFILFKLDKKFCIDENAPELRQKIKITIENNYPNWRRSRSGKLLFFATFRTQKERSLYDLSLPELKIVCAHYNLPKPKKFSKTYLTAFIEQELPKVSRNHPTRKNEIIFIPEISETEI